MKLRKKITAFLILCQMFLLNTISAYAGVDVSMDGNGNVSVGGSSVSGWSGIFSKFKNAAVGITGICVVVLVIALIICITNLGSSGSNPMKRGNSISWLIWILISIGLLGAVGTVFGIAYGLFS